MKSKEDFIKKIKTEKNKTIKNPYKKDFSIINYLPSPDKQSLIKFIKYGVTTILGGLLLSLTGGLLFFKSFTDLYDSSSINKIKHLTDELSKVEIVNTTDYNNSLIITNFLLTNKDVIFLFGIVICVILLTLIIIVSLLGRKKRE